MNDVSLTYHPAEGPVPAVRGVNLSVAAGEVLGVAGESGCGKSTLISTVLRLYPKSATVQGEVLVDGENVFDMKWNRMRAVRWGEAAVVFQGALHSLNPIQRIGQQLAEPILLHDKNATEASANRKVRELLEQVGLPARHANAYPHQLSGGQKQRIMIALALTCDVADAAASEAALSRILSDRGRPHLLVNCAGIAPGARIVEKEGPGSLAEFERIVRVNLTGTYNWLRLC